LHVSPALLTSKIGKKLRDFAGSGVNKTVALKPSAGMNKPRDKNYSKLSL
jgi:hypothetical protein